MRAAGVEIEVDPHRWFSADGHLNVEDLPDAALGVGGGAANQMRVPSSHITARVTSIEADREPVSDARVDWRLS